MDGILNIDKPAGMTSHDVVARVRKISGHRRVGHTGTLDPFATGVLVVLVGRATRLAQFLSGVDKEYEAVIRLGYATDTGDVTGTRIDSHASAQGFRKEEIESALVSLRGEIEQIPPMYSAKKIAGKKLYELARQGKEIVRQAVRVNIKDFAAIGRNGVWLNENDDGTKDLKVRVVCSAGTYVRTLAEDFGKKLGIGAHVAELRRTSAGRFQIADALTLDQLVEKAQTGVLAQALVAPDNALSHLPSLELTLDDVRRVGQGIDLRADAENAGDWPNDQPVRMRDANGQLIAVGIYDLEQQTVHPHVVIVNV